MRKRILFVHSFVERPNGPDQCLYRLLYRLDQTQFEPYLIVPEYNDIVKKYEPLVAHIDVVPRVIVVNVPSLSQLPSFLAENVRDRKAVRNVLETHQIELVHNNVESCWLVGMVAKRMGIPSVMQIHGLTAIQGKAREAIVPRAMIASADTFVAVSNVVGQAYIAAGIPAERMNIIDNGVEVDVFRPDIPRDYLRKTYNIPADVPLIGAVGAADYRKGWIELLEACVVLRERHPGLQCLFVGDDGRMGAGKAPYRGDESYADLVKKTFEHHQLHDTVQFIGPQNDMPPIYASLDLLIQPSLIEAGPRAIIESFGVGVPVVATKVGGNADYITHQHDGWHVPLGDVPALTDATTTLLNDDDMRRKMGKNARETAVNRFSLTHHVAQFEQLYNSQ